MKPLNFIIIALLITMFSCKKEAGEGGSSLIQGKVIERKMSPSFSLCYGQYNAADKKVFIVYGDGTSPGNDVTSAPDGHFEFPYLRKGKYKVYVYGNDSARTVGHIDHWDSTFAIPSPVYNPLPDPSAPKKAEMKEIEITKNHQILDVGTIVIYN